MANPDDEPIWAAYRVVAPTPGPTIIMPATANEFAIKGNHLTLFKGTNLMVELKPILTNTFTNSSVRSWKIHLPRDFVIPKMEEDSKVPLILGRPFLHTADAIIRVKQKHSYSNDDTCFSIDVIDEILKEDFDALLDEGSKILYSIKGNPLEDNIFAEFDEFITMNIEESTKPKINEEEITFKKITFDTDYKVKKSVEEPPTDVELKPLPGHLEYAFLEEPSFLPVIISSQLSEQNKDKLISFLKRHKQAFA
nr:reverse transcriptase domain-containing protein [Tanacetum cinerariifolium]